MTGYCKICGEQACDCNSLNPVIWNGCVFCTAACPLFRVNKHKTSPHEPSGKCEITGKYDAECFPWYKAKLEAVLAITDPLGFDDMQSPEYVCAMGRVRALLDEKGVPDAPQD